MPLQKRKYSTRRKTVRRKVWARRPVRRVRRIAANVYHYKRKVFYKDQIIVNSGTDNFSSYLFSLNLVPGNTDFTNLYDMYRINKIVFTIIPKISESTLASGQTTPNANLQQIHSVLDYDDSTAVTSIANLCEYQTHRMTRGNQVHTRVFVPKCELGDGVGASFPKSKQWIDCDNLSQAHRGVKIGIPAPAAAGTQTAYDILVTYYMSFKNVL